ncbi:MAG: putative Ig domain-containing protein [Candidatus Moraniibacteriota bacterium]
MNKKTKIIYATFLLILSLFIFSKISQAAFFPLEITNIKPAGTGDPAIPSTNRIFRAYPGIEYNIRAAVIGGTYPYTYSLSNQPEGMTINPRTGEISWPNPQTDANNISLSVTDSEDTTVQTSWSIAVTEEGFIFVDSAYSGDETGSIEKPYSSVLSMLSSTINGDNSRIVYFRGGNYILPAHNSNPNAEIALITGKAATNLNDNPATWLGYPGEDVNIDGDERLFSVFSTSPYFDKLNLSNFSDYGMLMGNNNSYMTIRRCSWSNIVAVRTVNENQGFLFLSRSGAFGSFFVIQDNEFFNFTGASAIGSLYDHNKILIENNYIHSSGGAGINGLNHPLMPKENLSYTTIRGNKVIVDKGLILNARLYNSDYTEILYNLFYRQVSTERATAFETNTEGYTESGTTKRVKFWRNTVTQDVYFRFINPENCSFSGPYYLNDNIILNPNSNASTYETYNFLSFNNDGGMTAQQRIARRACINDENNLYNTNIASVIDSDGLLTLGYSEYLGYNGWQFGDGSTPVNFVENTDIISPNSPTGLNVL